MERLCPSGLQHEAANPCEDRLAPSCEPTQCNTTEYLVMGTVAALSSILPLGRFHCKNLKPTGLLLSCAGTSPRQSPIRPCCTTFPDHSRPENSRTADPVVQWVLLAAPSRSGQQFACRSGRFCKPSGSGSPGDIASIERGDLYGPSDPIAAGRSWRRRRLTGLSAARLSRLRSAAIRR